MTNPEFQDQGSLDQPEQQVPTADQEPQDRVKDVPAGPDGGGPVNPVKGLGNPDADVPTRQPQEADPAVEADNTSAAALPQVNEARESGEPLGTVGDGTEQPAATPGGTGVSAGAGAGTVDT